MPIVPGANVTKSVQTSTTYSPNAAFNPDKKEFFRTEITTLGLLDGNCTSDGVNLTVPSGTAFIQNGIIVRLTANFVIPIPGIGFPKFVVADNANENSGSPVTIEIL